MTTASAPQDDIAVAYMARRARIQRREDLDFLLQGTDNKPPANTPKALSPQMKAGDWLIPFSTQPDAVLKTRP